MQENVMSIFDKSIEMESLLKAYERDSKKRFKPEVSKLVAYCDTINLHMEQMDVELDSSEEEAYANLYANFMALYNKFVAYLEHYDYASASNDFEKNTRDTLNANLNKMATLIEQLKQLDKAYNKVNVAAGIEQKDISFWHNSPYYRVKGGALPRIPESRKSRRFRHIKRAFAIALVLFIIFIYAQAIMLDRTNKPDREPDVAITDVSDSDLSEVKNPEKENHTVEEWWRYERSLIAPDENNTFTFCGRKIILGQTTLQELKDYGFDFSQHSYESEFDLDGQHYIVQNNDLYYNYDAENVEFYYADSVSDLSSDRISFAEYNNLLGTYAPGFGTVTINYADYSSVNFTFSSFEDVPVNELDLSRCIVSGLNIRYYNNNTVISYNYHDVNQDMSYEELLSKFDLADITYTNQSDDDNDGISDTYTVTHQLDKHMQTYTYCRQYPDRDEEVISFEAAYY